MSETSGGMIVVENVVKRYGATVALGGVSWRMGAGEVVGFLGPNGAGKTTLLKIIATWLPPTSGRVAVAGHDVVRAPLAVRRSLGYLPEHNALYEGMRADRFLRFVGRVHGLAGARLGDRLAWVEDRCALREVIGKRLSECSKGNRQRVGLAAALIHDPPVLVLDEPTHGLDPVQTVAFRDFLRELKRDRAIIFSSHILSEAAAVSDRLLVIDRGRLLLDAPTADLERRARESGASLEALLLDTVRASGPDPTAGQGSLAERRA